MEISRSAKNAEALNSSDFYKIFIPLAVLLLRKSYEPVLNLQHSSPIRQHFICTGLIALVAIACFLLIPHESYRSSALVMMMASSIIAMLFDIVPVLVATTVGALIWNFFFIPPVFTFHIASAEDLLMFFLYFLIAAINAVLTKKIRITEKSLQEEKKKEETLQLYNTILNSLSHELRTPISTIVGTVEHLIDQDHQLSKEQKLDLLKDIERNGWRLNHQVENLLNMSRLESGQFKIKSDWVDMHELGYQLKEAVDFKHHSFQLFTPDEMPLCKIDSALLDVALINLLHNAVNHNETECKIGLRFYCSTSHLICEVTDNGVGISEEDQPLIFDKFYRAKRTSSKGTGLGLSIVKGFCEAMNGQIEYRSIHPHGTCFAISIPCEFSYLNLLKHE